MAGRQIILLGPHALNCSEPVNTNLFFFYLLVSEGVVDKGKQYRYFYGHLENI